MKVLVLGGTGMAGHVISIFLQDAGHEVVALSRKKFDVVKNIIGDVTDFDNLKKIITNGNYDAIINCVGILNEDAEANKSKAVLINSYLPHFLSDLTKKSNIKIVHLSTDCVFSGKTGSYTETSFPDGMSLYDRSKALGELNNPKDLTFRNSIIGPDLKEEGIGLFNWFMKDHKEINGFDNAYWTGVTTVTLAKAIDKALIEDLSGLYHLVNNESITKYKLLKLFNKNMKKNKIKINKYQNEYVNKSLLNTRNDFSFIVPSYEEMISEMKEWINEHKELYEHYNILD